MLKTSELCLMTTLEVTLYVCMLNISKYPIINLQVTTHALHIQL